MDEPQQPKRRGRKATSTTPKLGIALSEDVAARLAEIQASVRGVGHAWPSQQTLVSALILYEKRRGEDVERELLMPFRLAHPEAE